MVWPRLALGPLYSLGYLKTYSNLLLQSSKFWVYWYRPLPPVFTTHNYKIGQRSFLATLVIYPVTY